jgi:ParB/RepB/Spo0J family partition protein
MLPHVTREYRELPLASIDPPALDARIDRDPDMLQELADDVARRGVIYPLALVQTGERFEIVDGFRRYLAAKQAGLVAVPSLIYPTKTAALEGVKYAANMFREDMSPAEEAIFFHELLTHECGGDIEKLCALVNKKLSYVDNRLELLGGDAEVFEALKHRRITIGVAQELNKLANEGFRRYYLLHAVKQGATVSAVSAWIADWHATYDNVPPSAAAEVTVAPSTAASSFDPMRCYVCQESDPKYLPETINVHTHCLRAILDKLLAAYRGAEPSET